MMWTIVEAIGAIILIILGVLLSITLALYLIELIKEALIELEWIDNDDEDDEDDEELEEYNGRL